MGSTHKHNDKEHRFATENLSAYLDSELSERDLQRVRKHLGVCIECQQELAALKSTVAFVRRAPMHACPRSFTLPTTLRTIPRSAQRWNTAYSFARGGMLAVTAMFLLTVGLNVMFRTGAVRLPGWQTTTTAPDYAGRSAEASPTEPVAVVVTVVAEKEVEAEAAVEHALTSPGPSEAEAMKGLDGPAPQSSPVPEPESTVAAPVQQAPSALGTQPTVVFGSGSPVAESEGVASTSREGTPATEALDVQVEDSASDSAKAVPTEAPMNLSAPSPEAPGPTAAPMARGLPSAEAIAPAEKSAPASEPAPTTDARGLVVWQVARMLTGILFGLLLILAAVLVWTGYKRNAH
jgi:anti-sigma factor RsiW